LCGEVRDSAIQRVTLQHLAILRCRVRVSAQWPAIKTEIFLVFPVLRCL
jgi:hypothetical protein